MARSKKADTTAVALSWIDGPWLGKEMTVEPYAVRWPLLMSRPQWEELGQPGIVIRYAIGRGRAVDRFAYCRTAHPAYRPGLVALQTPANCVRIDVGIITPTGDVWIAPELSWLKSLPATCKMIENETGQRCISLMWDHSLSGGPDTYIFVADDGEARKTPYGAALVQYPDVYRVLGIPRPGDTGDETDEHEPVGADHE
jgi:hypothetical protein